MIRPDAATGELVQVLRIHPVLAETPGFELALRERVARLGHLRNASYARIHRVERLDSSSSGWLGLVSEHVEGVRLSELLRIASEREVDIDISTTISTIRQLVSNTALLHEHAADIAHGLISPERLIVTPRGRIVIGDHVLAGAVATLHYTPERLWRDLRIAVCPSASPGRITHRDDVVAIGLVALALVLGRPVREDEFPARLPALLDSARERSAFGHERRLSDPFRGWLARALQLDLRQAFGSASDAWVAFEQMVAADPVYTGTPIALEMFLYSCTAALIRPAGVQAPPADPPAPSRPARLEAGPPAREPAPTGPQGVPAAAAPREAPAAMPDLRPVRPAAAAPAGIDWSAARPPAAPVATARDITDLFSAVDRLEREATDGSDADTADSGFPPGDLDAGLDDLPEPVTQSLRESVLPEPGWEIPDLPRQPRGWRRLAIAAGILALAGGGIAVTRLLQPPVMAAMENASLSVESDPAGLQVLLDGVVRGVTPARIAVPAGEHLLEVRGPGAARVVPLTINGGEDISRHFEFVAATRPGGSTPEFAGTADSSGMRAGTATTGVVPTSPEAAPPGAPMQPDVPLAPTTWGWLAVKAPFPLQIQVGERVFTSSGQRIRFGEGRHRIELRNTAEGFREVRVVHVVAGKVTDVAVEPPAAGSVNVNASPWAEVWIGGRRVGETPIANIAVPAGQHEVVLRHPELGEKKQTIAVVPGTPVRLSVDMR